MITMDNFVVIVVLLILILSASACLYRSYFGIRIRQKGLEKTFNKEVLKSAGFSSLSKRIFELCFDLFIFWLFFYYKDGIILSRTKSILQVVYEKMVFILPISRKGLTSIDFVLYSFIAITVIAAITALLCTISMDLKVLGFCIIGFSLFVTIWYIDLGICYIFFRFFHVGTAATLLNYILAIACYVLVLIVDGIIFSFIDDR